MSAFDFFSLPTTREPAAAPPPPAEPAAASEPSRSFRTELAEADPERDAIARPSRDTADAEAATRNTESTPEAASEPAASTATEASATTEPETETEALPTDEPVESDTDVATAAEDGESRVAELVVELISAFEDVLDSNPLLQPTGDGVTTATDGESANAYPGLTALFEALSAVAGLNGNQAGSNPATATPATGVVAAPGVTPAPVLPGLASAADGSALTLTPEQAAGQAQTNGDPGTSSQNQNNNGTANGNAANNLAADPARPSSVAAAPSVAPQVIPTADATGSAAVQALTPATNTNPANAASALNPTAALADPNANSDALNSARLTRGLNNAVNQQGGSVTLRLTPPDLGTVRIQLNLSGTNVSAQFHAETAPAQRLLTQQLGQLRTTLEAQGRLMFGLRIMKSPNCR